MLPAMKKVCLIMLLAAGLLSCEDMGMNKDMAGPDTGIGGSTARFTVSGDFLYIVNNTNLNVVDVSTPQDPEFVSTTELGWGIETIFPYKDNLFIGGQTGMQIWSIEDGGSPQYVSGFQHTTTCDPVIANDQYAYVTIRSGVGCNGMFEVNQLITLDISNLSSPFVTSEVQMINPRGLTFFRGDLFVAEGNHGLKRFSLADPSKPQLINFYDDIPANDMIGLSNTMIITHDSGIDQFGWEAEQLQFFSPIQ